MKHETFSSSSTDVNEIKFTVFSNLMDEFQKERDTSNQKILELQGIIQAATKDVVHLSQENSMLREKLTSATIYEPKILPTRSKEFQ